MKVYKRYKIDEIQKSLRMAERLGDKTIWNWAEILRTTESILKNADKDEASQERARKRFLEVLADMDAEEVPPPLRPIITSAQAILEGEDEKDEKATRNTTR